METSKPKLHWIRAEAQAVLGEHALSGEGKAAKTRRFVHFWILVGRSFNRNRCPVRASALAYATLLALIPMLAVAVSITSSFLKKEGEDRIDQLIVKMVASLTPPATMGTNSVAPPAQGQAESTAPAASSPAKPDDTAANAPAADGFSAFAQDQKTVAARKAIAREINQFIQNTRSGALGVTGSVVLIFAAISMLSRIESTFNDIWGVARGRSWFMRIVLYWGVLSLAPLLLVVAIGLANGPHLDSTKRLIGTMPFVGNLILHLGFQVLPVLLLCLAFGLFYMLMPNARVHWKAALTGGLVGGLLFHLNNVVSVLYVSRVVSNSRIYGSLGLVPVFMIGLYFAWLILLFGAQVAYAYQNRATYLEEKQIESVNQQSREFIALRLMTSVGLRFGRSQPPPGIMDLSTELGVPTRLIRQVLEPLQAARLVVETAGAESGLVPARSLEAITCHDILAALRAAQGQEFATREEPSRARVQAEFDRIREAERQAGGAVTLQTLVDRIDAKEEREKSRACG